MSSPLQGRVSGVSPRPWHDVESQKILDNPVLQVELVTRRQNSGLSHPFVVLRSRPWVNVVALDEAGEVILIRQWRQGSAGLSLEIPGGLVDPGETPEQAAARELREETGYQAASLQFLGKVNPNNALFDNACHTFLASPCTRAGEVRPDEHEEIEVFTVPMGRLKEMVLNGEIDHSLVIAALAFFWLRNSC